MSVLRLVANNPFRVLGVFANARPAEIVSNCDDMEAYVSIGQTVKFDLDLNNLMPDVVRSADSVSDAKRRINLPKDKLKYALFWFVRDSSSLHALNHLKNNSFDDANSVFEIEDTFSTYINKAVVAMIQDDLGTAISFATKIIHDNDDLGFRDDFIRTICGDAFSISEEDFAHLYIDALLEEISASRLLELFDESGVSQNDVDYLKEKAVNEPISRINAEITKAKAVKHNDAIANFLAGKMLIQNTKSDLSKVKNLLDVSDMKYQIIADDLANAILQCGINYYNNTDDEDSIEDAMFLQKYASTIAVGKMCKDRCNQNVAILEKKKQEHVIEADLSAIANEIKSFQNRTSSIENARTFVNNCTPHLNIIKNRLGNSNNLYLKISSVVASNALGMLISDINATQSSSYGLKSKVDAAISVMNIIGALDMDQSTRDRFFTNNNTLMNMQFQFSMASLQTPLSVNIPSSSSNSSGDDIEWGCIIHIVIAIIFIIIWIIN